MTKEMLIRSIMVECQKDGEPVTEKEAAEMAEMELKAKANGRRYEGDTKGKKRTPKERKVDTEKLRLIELFAVCLLEPSYIDSKLPFAVSDVMVTNDQKEITFNVGQNEYSLTLTKHRRKK